VSSLPLIAAGLSLAAAIAILFWSFIGRRRTQKEAAGLREELDRLQHDLQTEQGKAQNLLGHMSRLQNFGIAATGRIPEREFSETLIDSAASLLHAEQVILFKIDEASLDLLPVASRGYSPESLSRLRVRLGEGVLGKAALDRKTLVQNNRDDQSAKDFPAAPYIVSPLMSQARCQGLLFVAKPQEGPFSAQARDLVGLLAAQAALTFEDHSLFKDRQQLCDQITDALTRAIEAKDTYTHRHSHRTRSLVRAVTKEMSLPESLTREIEFGAFLHDVGKIGVEDAVLRKPGKLTPAEYDIMKRHAVMGHRILQPITFLKQVAAIVLYHQEWYNGAGYPEGLAGEEIPLGARIVQVIDAWDAMTSDRPYRQAMTSTAAITELRHQAGTQFDPKLVDLFLKVLDRLEREGVSTTEEKGRSAITADLP